MAAHTHHPPLRVLAIDPSRRGFGFAVLEDKPRLVDWGVAVLYSKSDEELLVRVEALVERYDINLIVIEDTTNTRRRARAIRSIKAIGGYVRSRRIAVSLVSRSMVQATFSATGATKHDIANAIAERYPELEPRLPRKRQLWDTEDERMNIFDAVSLALAAIG